MDSGLLRRRTVALVAAYAVALQALLTVFVPIAAASESGLLAVLCSHDAAGGTGVPAQHDLPCAAICAAMGHGIAGAAPPDTLAGTAAPHAVAAAMPLLDWVTPQVARTDTHAPRGPPLA